MKITRKQLRKIIKEEINEVTLYNQDTGEPFELGAKTSDFVLQQLGRPPSPHRRKGTYQSEKTVAEPRDADHNVLLIARALQGIYTDADPDTRYEVAKMMLDVADSQLGR